MILNLSCVWHALLSLSVDCRLNAMSEEKTRSRSRSNCPCYSRWEQRELQEDWIQDVEEQEKQEDVEQQELQEQQEVQDQEQTRSRSVDRVGATCAAARAYIVLRARAVRQVRHHLDVVPWAISI